MFRRLMSGLPLFGKKFLRVISGASLLSFSVGAAPLPAILCRLCRAGAQAHLTHARHALGAYTFALSVVVSETDRLSGSVRDESALRVPFRGSFVLVGRGPLASHSFSSEYCELLLHSSSLPFPSRGARTSNRRGRYIPILLRPVGHGASATCLGLLARNSRAGSLTCLPRLRGLKRSPLHLSSATTSKRQGFG